MLIMSDSHFQYRSNQNQFQNDWMSGKHYLLKQNNPFLLVVLSLTSIVAIENTVFVWR